MQTLQWISISNFVLDPEQPRKLFDQAGLLALGQNMKAYGQQVPVICYPVDGKQQICDGARRVLASKPVGIEQLLALVLPEKPDAATLHIVQMSLEAHKVGLSVMERSNFLNRIREENRWSVSELAGQLHMKQPLVSKHLACQRLDTGIQNLLHTGGLDLEKAFIISQEPDFERQREMVKLYAHLPRDQFRQKTKPVAKTDQVKVKRARFALPDGTTVTVHGPELTLASAIECLLQTVKELRRSQAKNLDITKAQNLMKKAEKTHVRLVNGNESAR